MWKVIFFGPFLVDVQKTLLKQVFQHTLKAKKAKTIPFWGVITWDKFVAT